MVLTKKIDCDIIDKSQGKRYKFGSIAQLGEHLPYKQRVIGSSPIVSTTQFNFRRNLSRAICLQMAPI